MRCGPCVITMEQPVNGKEACEIVIKAYYCAVHK